MSERTIREFSAKADVWSIVERWAKEYGFTTIDQDAHHRVYRRGRERFDYPILVEISQMNERVRLAAWVKASTLDRGRALFMIPAEMGLESGGAQMVIARNGGRKLVNELLHHLGERPIM